MRALILITQSGLSGVAKYKFSPNWGLDFGEEKTLPESGEIELIDSSVVTFTGELVKDDTYRWFNKSLVSEYYRTPCIRYLFSLQFFAASKAELLAGNGLIPRLMTLLRKFPNRYFEVDALEGDLPVMVELKLGRAYMPLLEEDRRAKVKRMILDVEAVGGAYETATYAGYDRVPLTGEVK